MRGTMQDPVSAALLLLAGLQWAFAQQMYSPSPRENCTELKLNSDCKMVVAARPRHDTSESALLSLVGQNTTRLEGYDIPPTCWSDAGDLTVQDSHSACMTMVHPEEEYLFCLEAVSEECPRLASGIKPVPLVPLTQTAYTAPNGGPALLRRRRQERQSSSKGLIKCDDLYLKSS